MRVFEQYRQGYGTVKLDRTDDGVLEVRFHTDDGPLQWSHIGGAHDDFTALFEDIAQDRDNRLVIMTGTGDVFSGPPADPAAKPAGGHDVWERLRFDASLLMKNLLAIPAPIIACINGPAWRHSEIPLLADIVLAADDALIQDGHFINRLVPGDGANVVFPLLLGWNRARYFLLTGQQIGAAELKALGLVSEVLPRADLLPRARELAHQLLRQNPLALRYSRIVLTEHIRDLMERHVPHSLALEVVAALHEESRQHPGPASGDQERR